MSGIPINNSIVNGGVIPIIMQLPLGQRPAPGIYHRWFVTTDQSPNIIYRDDVTVWTPIFTGGGGALTDADNGLHVQGGNTVELGGTLIKNTDIDPATFVLSINGSFIINKPLLILEPGGAIIGLVDAAHTFSGFETDGTAAQIFIAGVSMFEIANTGTNLRDNTGFYASITRSLLNSLAVANADVTKFLQADASGNITNAALPAATVTGADNGLSLSTGDVQLGGTLIQDTDIDPATFALTINGAANNSLAYLALNGAGAETDIGVIDSTGNLTGLEALPAEVDLVVASTIVLHLELMTVRFPSLANANTNAFLQADGTGIVTNVDGAGKFILNQTTPTQNPGNFNIQGEGILNNDDTNSTMGVHALLPITTFNWNNPTSIANGALYASTFNWVKHIFSSSETFPNSASNQALFSRLELDGLVNSTITMTPGTGGKVRALSAIGGQVYLPPVAPGVIVTVSDVAGIVAPGLFQDAGTTNSVRMNNYYGHLIPQTDEGLPFPAAVVAKWGLYQDGAADQNLLRGPIRATNIASASGSNLVQVDNAGNLSSGIIYKDVLEQAITSLITWTVTAPSSPQALTYRWSQVGNRVSARFNLIYNTPGVADSTVSITLPSDMPTPAVPSGYGGGATSANFGSGSGTVATGLTVGTASADVQLCYRSTTGTYQIIAFFASIAAVSFFCTIEYYTT